MNPMMAVLSQGRLAPLKQAMQMANPQMMLQQMLGQNPNYARAQQLIQQAGGDPQKAFYDLANQMGVDPNEILSALK